MTQCLETMINPIKGYVSDSQLSVGGGWGGYCGPPLEINEGAPCDTILLRSFLKHIVKLQSKVQTSVCGIGVDFVLPLAQQEEQQQQEEQESSPKSIRRGCTRILKFDTKTTHGLLDLFRELGV